MRRHAARSHRWKGGPVAHGLHRPEVYDAGEACFLIAVGWRLEEVRTLQRWNHGHYSETTSYVVGLPENSVRDVATVSLNV